MRILASAVVTRAIEKSGLSPSEFYSPLRTAKIARARQVAMYAVRHLCPHMSYPMIAGLLGKGDHTTALHGVARIEKLRDTDPAVASSVNALFASFGRNPPAPKSIVGFQTLCRDYEGRLQSYRLAA